MALNARNCWMLLSSVFEWRILQFFVDAPVRIVPDKEQTVPTPQMACDSGFFPHANVKQSQMRRVMGSFKTHARL